MLFAPEFRDTPRLSGENSGVSRAFPVMKMGLPSVVSTDPILIMGMAMAGATRLAARSLGTPSYGIAMKKPRGGSPECGAIVASLPLAGQGPFVHVAPSQELYVIRQNHKTDERTLDLLRWGLIPHG
jgi:hypothetical protein